MIGKLSLAVLGVCTALSAWGQETPADFSVQVPLASTFLLSTKAGKEAWVEPVVEGSQYRFEVQVTDGKGLVVCDLA